MGLLKKTIFPFKLASPSESNSFQELISTTFPFTTPSVPIDPPNAVQCVLIVFPFLSFHFTFSTFPLTHLGTLTGCKYTESSFMLRIKS